DLGLVISRSCSRRCSLFGSVRRLVIVVVLHFFSGTHTDYHKPSDTADKINAAGAAQTAKIVGMVASMISLKETPLAFKADAQGPAPRGDMRSFNASLGTIPDYGGPGAGKKGVLLPGVPQG